MKKEFYSLNESESLIRNVLERGGTFKFYPRGTSMYPMIREGRDMVLLTSIPARLKKYQAVLYKRENGAFVLHRIVGISDNSYTMRGDNQFVLEHGIKKEQMIGLVCAIENEKQKIDTQQFGYRCKIVIWVKSTWIRKWIRRGCSVCKKIKNLIWERIV